MAGYLEYVTNVSVTIQEGNFLECPSDYKFFKNKSIEFGSKRHITVNLAYY